jgi:fatty-acyl-CoA synthase
VNEIRVLRDALARAAREHPTELAYSFGGKRLSFAELAERAAARAGGLQRSGVGRGDRVAIAMSAGLPFVEVFWALQLLGAVPCALNPTIPEPTLARRIARLRPTAVLTDASAAEPPTGQANAELPDLDPEDLAFLQLTSGTSGEPRAAMIAHRSVVGYLRGLAADGHIATGDVLVSWMPPWHDFGLVQLVIAAVWSGAGLHLLEPSIWSIPAWLETISTVGATITGGTDSSYRLAARMVLPARVDLGSLRAAFNGAEPVRWHSIEQFETRFGTPGVIRPGYGLAEATVGVTLHRAGEELVVDGRGNVSCGRPISGFEVAAGADVDRPEEIRVRGEAVFTGYFEADEETAGTLREGWLHTGDSGYLDDAGRLFVLGRRRGMIKRAGGVIAPRELEEAAEQVDGVRIAAAIGIPAGTSGDDQIVIAVETKSRRASAERISAEVSRSITAALGFAPGRVCVLPPKTIPRTDNGKVRHSLLRSVLGEHAVD